MRRQCGTADEGSAEPRQRGPRDERLKNLTPPVPLCAGLPARPRRTMEGDGRHSRSRNLALSDTRLRGGTSSWPSLEPRRTPGSRNLRRVMAPCGSPRARTSTPPRALRSPRQACGTDARHRATGADRPRRGPRSRGVRPVPRGVPQSRDVRARARRPRRGRALRSAARASSRCRSRRPPLNRPSPEKANWPPAREPPGGRGLRLAGRGRSRFRCLGFGVEQRTRHDEGCDQLEGLFEALGAAKGGGVSGPSYSGHEDCKPGHGQQYQKDYGQEPFPKL